MKGWTKFKDEFNEVFRGLTQLGYTVFFIGHDKEIKNNDGTIVGIRPALSNSTREVIGGMADIYAYAHQKAAGEMSVLTLRDPSGYIECGCRFKYVPNEVPTNYHALVNAIQTAIDKEAAEHNNAFVTSEKITVPEAKSYDYDSLKIEFQNLATEIMQKEPTAASKITQIVEKYLGKDKKASDTTPDQAEFLYLINTELKEDLLNK